MTINALSANPSISYNGVKLPLQLSVTESSRCIRDSSNRFNKHILTTYTIQAVIHSTDTYGEVIDPITSTTMSFATYVSTYDFSDLITLLKQRLSQSAGEFTITNHFAGNPLSLNTSAKHDFLYGPHPNSVDIQPLGGTVATTSACILNFSLTVAYHTCETTVGNVLEHSVSMSWSIGSNGLTTRTVAGSLEIVAFRISPAAEFPSAPHGNEPLADFYRDKIQVQSLEEFGFQRVQQSFSESEDHRRLSYQIVDQEIASDNAYYPGIVSCQASYNIANQNVGMVNWDATLSMTAEVAKGYPRFFAWLAFLSTLNRIHEKNNQGRFQGNEKPIKLITRLSIQEEIFGRSMSFTCQWWLALGLESLLQHGGFWTENPDNTWAGWANSMQTVTSLRGTANLSTTLEAGKIVNVCLNDGTLQVQPQDVRYNPYTSQNYLSLICPDPKNSWLKWQNEFKLIYNTDTINFRYLQGNSETQPTAPADSAETRQGLPPDKGDVTETETIQRASSDYQVMMKGYAIRIGYEIPAWSLTKYGGANATMIGSPTWSQRRFDTNACGIYICRWKILYQLDKKPVGSMVEVEEHDSTDFETDSN